MSDEDILDALVKFPKLIQRPIVIDEKSGVIGRPKELVEDFIK
ncbi:ArsC/Spx/MgsR family protein [Chishuiella sp.]